MQIERFPFPHPGWVIHISTGISATFRPIPFPQFPHPDFPCLVESKRRSFVPGLILSNKSIMSHVRSVIGWKWATLVLDEIFFFCHPVAEIGMEWLQNESGQRQTSVRPPGIRHNGHYYIYCVFFFASKIDLKRMWHCYFINYSKMIYIVSFVWR